MAELITNSMRFCGDILDVVDEETGVAQTFVKKAFLVPNSKRYINFTNAAAVKGFKVSGQTYTGCKRRVIFAIYEPGETYDPDDTTHLYYWNPTYGEMRHYGHAGKYDDVIVYGNKPDVLAATYGTDIPFLIGKKVYPRIAMKAPSDLPNMPTIKIEGVYFTSSDILVDETETDEIPLGDESATPIVESVEAETSVTGGGSVEVTVRLKGVDGTWSSYMSFADAANKTAQAAQFKIRRSVTTTDGTDSATCERVTVNHTLGKALVSGRDAYIYTKVQNYEEDLGTCYAVVRHSPLSDSKITAACSLKSEPKHRELIQIGVATGSRQQLILGVNGVADSHIDPSTITLYRGEYKVNNFGFNTETGEVTISEANTWPIFASYDYDCDEEVWADMTLESCQPYDESNHYMSRFSYSLPVSTTGKKIGNVRILLRRPTGTVTNWLLGTGNGKRQLFKPKHLVNESSIKFNPKPSGGYSYDADSNILCVKQKKNTEIRWSYTWRGEPITIYSIAAGFSARL